MRLDALDQVRKTKAAFRKKIHKLGAVVRANDKKADAKIEKLTGVVKSNAAKSARGRKSIAALEDANKNELHNSIRGAIAKGEKRAKLVEKRGAKMDKDTRWLVNNKLNTEISKLRDETNASVEALALQSKSARAEMKKEMLYAIRSAADVAKKDLAIAIQDGVKKMNAFQKKAASSHAKSALATGTINKVRAHEAKMRKALAHAGAKDAARQKAALKFAASSLAIAEKEASQKFGKAYERMAGNRANFDKKLGAATAGLNDALAKQAALADSRFSKTVKDLQSARHQASAQVRQLRKNFATEMVTVTAHVKNVETRLVGEIAVVSGEVISDKANQ